MLHRDLDRQICESVQSKIQYVPPQEREEKVCNFIDSKKGESFLTISPIVIFSACTQISGRLFV